MLERVKATVIADGAGQYGHDATDAPGAAREARCSRQQEPSARRVNRPLPDPEHGVKIMFALCKGCIEADLIGLYRRASGSVGLAEPTRPRRLC